MTEPVAPPRCAKHLESIASGTCPRCGNFICAECERRAELNSAAMCPGCWALAGPNIGRNQSGGTSLQTAGLVLGLLSIIPICLIHPFSLVVNIVAIVKAKHPPARDVRWKPIVGLVLTCLCFLLQVLFVALYNIFSTPR